MKLLHLLALIPLGLSGVAALPQSTPSKSPRENTKVQLQNCSHPIASPDDPTITTRVPCENLKIYCECGDHYMHWNEELEQCQCPACEPPAPRPTTEHRCEMLLIYCAEGDHRMHWNPISERCECPAATKPQV